MAFTRQRVTGRIEPMKDIIYIATSIAFFGVMLGYVKACRLLGARAEQQEQEQG